MTEPIEIVVVGAGPGGLSAALAAAQAGARVALVDNNRQPGGQYFRQPAREFRGAASPHQRQGADLWQRVQAAGVHWWAETTAWGAAETRVLTLAGNHAPSSIQPPAIILATGTYERTVAFPGWTLPGVMTAGAAQTLLKEQHLLPGKKILLVGTGPLQLVLAAELVRAGAHVVAVLEGAPIFQKGAAHLGSLWGQWERVVEGASSWLTLASHAVPYRTSWGIVAANGNRQVTSATIARLDAAWQPVAGSEEQIACDTICLGYGFIPFTALAQLLGAQMTWQPELGGDVPTRDANLQTSAPGVYAVGDGAGIGGAALAQVEGEIAGIAAAAQLGHHADTAAQKIQALLPRLTRERQFQKMYAALFTPGAGLDTLARDETILCRCEEITQADVRRAIALGANSAGEVKSITRGGMGDCQGRMCSHLLAHAIARETQQTLAQVGRVRPRPPLFPTPIPVLGQVQAARAEESLR